MQPNGVELGELERDCLKFISHCVYGNSQLCDLATHAEGNELHEENSTTTN